MKISAVLTACFLVLLAGIAWAAPKLVVDQSVYDFGAVPQGEKVLHTFVFTNDGDALLDISKLRSSCGCTAALLSSSQLQPGEQGEVKANFDSERFRGKVSKTIYLYSNDPVSPVTQLQITGEVLELFQLEPRQINFGEVAPDQRVEAVVTLTNRTGEDLRIDSVQTTTPQLTTRFDPQLPAGASREIRVLLKPKPGQQRFSGYVFLTIQGGGSYDLRLPVYATLK